MQLILSQIGFIKQISKDSFSVIITYIYTDILIEEREREKQLQITFLYQLDLNWFCTSSEYM